jgi:hypothetical protein
VTDPSGGSQEAHPGQSGTPIVPPKSRLAARHSVRAARAVTGATDEPRIEAHPGGSGLWIAGLSALSLLLLAALLLVSTRVVSPPGTLDAPWANLISGALVGVASSVVASILFAMLYQSRIEGFLENRANEQIRVTLDDHAERLAAAVRGDLSEHSSALQTQLQGTLVQHSADIVSHFRGYTPIRVYAATDSPNDEYNTYYEQHLHQSKSCRYKSDRALYLCYRLRQMESQRQIPPGFRVEALLLDPSNDLYLRVRARDRTRHKSLAGVRVDDVVAELKLDIYTSVYGLFTLRHSVNVDGAFFSEALLYRVELLDTLLVVSMMTSQGNGYYPDTLCYSPDSHFYRYFGVHFEDSFRVASRGTFFSFSADSDESELQEVLKQIGYTGAVQELEGRLKDYAQNLTG